MYGALKKKEERLKNIDKENDMPPKRHKSNDDSGNKIHVLIRIFQKALHK
jgi:hypothetical protein